MDKRMRATWVNGVNYSELRDDVVIAAAYFGLDAGECWRLARHSPKHAAVCYRAIVNSISPMQRWR